MKRLRDDGSSSQSVFLSGDLLQQWDSNLSSPSKGEQAMPLMRNLNPGNQFAVKIDREGKETLQDQREKYDMFLKIMKDFRAQRSDVSGAIAKVKELFEGHNKLISGFDIFLPKGSELALEHDEAAPQTKKIDFEEAINVVTKIKKHYHQNDRHYKAFVDILKMYRKEHKDKTKVYNEVATLLFRSSGFA
uniref:Paired amphipathic helix protein Sin3-like 2 n=1 Tax=Quercus lobata TaxID=97700 RepID=A0A7N2KZB0_QUELO